jgi:molybdopterin/thiamine biosynthesis adenylyltransferase
MKTVPDALRPGWDRRFPGRLDWELERLNAQGRNVDINDAKLAEGTVEVDLEWPVRGQWVPVRGTFPDTYPDTRPHVQLLTDRDTWPMRHISPLDGSLCLLGRNPRQWRADDGLAGLLMTQLETTLHGGGREDPQAEPMEVWWNHAGLPDSYCLVDSGWKLSTAEAGTFEAKLVVDAPRNRAGHAGGPLPAFRMAITKVLTIAGEVASWSGPLPAELQAARSFTFKWARAQTILVPGPAGAGKLTELRQLGAKFGPVVAGHGLLVRATGFIHPIELTEGVEGDGWLIVMEWGKHRDFTPTHGKHAPMRAPQSRTIAVFRAGPSDLEARVPALSALGGKKVALVGVGAIGAPIAIELARNGVAELRLLDHDIVEPGNSVRWPLGAASWGQPKVQAVREFLANHYPRCKVVPIQHMIGGLGRPDDHALHELLDAADLLLDASASSTVNLILWRRCQEAGLPMIKVGATPEVRGGTVMALAVNGPCPTCLSIARAAKEVETPAGEDDPLRMQPIGCAEPTFIGAGFDLQELSLQAVRVAVDVLRAGLATSQVYTLSLRDAADNVVPPTWSTQSIDIQDGCPSHISAGT